MPRCDLLILNCGAGEPCTEERTLRAPVFCLLVAWVGKDITDGAEMSCPHDQTDHSYRSPPISPLVLLSEILLLCDFACINYPDMWKYWVYQYTSTRPSLQQWSLGLKMMCRGTWVAQSVKRLTSTWIMISWSVGSSPVSGSVLTAQSLEPALDSVSPSLSAPPWLVFSLYLSLFLSLCLKNK